MEFIDYKEKYQRMDYEYDCLQAKKSVEETKSDLSKHPKVNKDWLDYARDQKFIFSGLRLPNDENCDFYKDAENNIYDFSRLLTVYKDFTICPTCGTRWTLDISLNGEYAVYDQYGEIVIDTTNDENKYVKYYELPKHIETVMNIQKVIDVIEMNMHKVSE